MACGCGLGALATTNFKTLSRSGYEQQVKDESIRDTLIDFANYAIMTIVEMEMEDDR